MKYSLEDFNKNFPYREINQKNVIYQIENIFVTDEKLEQANALTLTVNYSNGLSESGYFPADDKGFSNGYIGLKSGLRPFLKQRLCY